MERSNVMNKKTYEMENFVQTVSDEELELLIGGDGNGFVKTLTKDCPQVVSEICVSGLGVTVCKDC